MIASSKKPATAFTAVIPLEAAGQRLDKCLTQILISQIPGLSRARLQALIAEGLVTRDGKPITDASRKVKADESYTANVPALEDAEPKAQKIPLTILFEDKDLLVIDKPAGMVVHPAPGNRDNTLVNALLAHCGKTLSGVGGVARPGIVHRIDKDTSGLLVVAKNDLAHQGLQKQFTDRSLSRVYRCLIWGTPMLLTGEIEGSIGRHPRDRKKMAVTKRGKAALTKYRVIESYDIASLIECKLATGRTHQIRVHLAHIKHPVIGDAVYGRNKLQAKDAITKLLYDFPRQALHAVELQFLHPRTGKKQRFKSELPKDMQKLLKKLQG